MTDIEKLLEELLEKPYWVVDILPKQVPEGSPGRYFTVDEYWLRKPELSGLHQKYFQILLKLYCYYDFQVSFDYGEGWAENPLPEVLEKWFARSGPAGAVHVILEAEGAMLVHASDDTYMTVYNPSPDLLDMLRALAGAEGLFVWKPEQ